MRTSEGARRVILEAAAFVCVLCLTAANAGAQEADAVFDAEQNLGRKVDADLVLGDVEPLGELGDVLRHECGDLLVEERHTDVPAGHDLLRELADDLAELDREEGAAEPSAIYHTNIRGGGYYH